MRINENGGKTKSVDPKTFSMLRAFGQRLRNMSQHNPAMLEYVAFICERFRRLRRKIVACSLVLLEVDDEGEVKRGKPRLWSKTRQGKGYFANKVEELMTEDERVTGKCS